MAIGPETQELSNRLRELITVECAILDLLKSQIPAFNPEIKFTTIDLSIGTGANVLAAAAQLFTRLPISRFRIYVEMDTATTFSAIKTPQAGGTARNHTFNEGSALVAGANYLFDMMVLPTQNINFTHGGAGTVVFRELTVVEIPAVGD